MGSLFKAPKVPTPQSVRRVTPAPVPLPTPTTEPEKEASEIQAEARERSLLRRSRGRFGTITTGFTGFLSSSEPDKNRKTLLGE